MGVTVSDDVQAGPGEMPWHVYSRQVFEFAVVLRDADDMPDDEDEYWEKPWRFEPVHLLWVEAGSPRCPSDGGPPSLGWQRFLRSVVAYRDADD